MTMLAAWLAIGSMTAQTPLATQAQTPGAREEIAANPFLSASNHLDYDHQLPETPLTPAPEGYEPYYMSHYGRHGSRWLLSDGEYMGSIKILRKAQAEGKLTERGASVLADLERFYPCTKDRLGDLTTVGERQHHGIGRRMAEHFPELFCRKGLPIDARSTVVIRCILSMEAECEELMAANPTARIHNDVSEAFQFYLNQRWPDAQREANRKAWSVANDYKQRLTPTERLTQLLFNDRQWVADSVKAVAFVRGLFNVANNMQSHDTDIDLLSLFTTDELYALWRTKNIDWYLSYGASPATDGIMPFTQLNLLKNILATADTVTTPQATLRFGHEVCVMPLACLLELDDCGAAVENLDTLDRVWRNYRIFPMACNIQLVFYRPTGGREGDVLVKALLNERETRLPIPTDRHPYYRWADLRDYYLRKIAAYETRMGKGE